MYYIFMGNMTIFKIVSLLSIVIRLRFLKGHDTVSCHDSKSMKGKLTPVAMYTSSFTLSRYRGLTCCKFLNTFDVFFFAFWYRFGSSIKPRFSINHLWIEFEDNILHHHCWQRSFARERMYLRWLQIGAFGRNKIWKMDFTCTVCTEIQLLDFKCTHVQMLDINKMFGRKPRPLPRGFKSHSYKSTQTVRTAT